MYKHTTAIALGLLALTGMSVVTAAEDVVYGHQLMTEQELAEHRAKMRSLKTEEEREQYRLEHHERMQERAKARGVTLPDEPRHRPRDGAGMGYGPRDGSGPGKGRP